jgi:serine/alanine racemase
MPNSETVNKIGERGMYNGVDLLKFLCAILVLFIHTQPLQDISAFGELLLVNFLARIAVPVFFIASGFFFYKKILREGFKLKVLGNYLRRLLVVYLIWTVIYLPYDLLYPLFSFHDEGRKLALYYLWRVFFTGSHFHLWYLPGLMTAITLLFVLCKYLNLKIVGVILFFLYLVGLMGDSYFELAKQIGAGTFFYKLFFYVGPTRSGLFFGAIYVFAGAWFATMENKFRLKTKQLILLVCALAVVYLAEVIAISEYDLARDQNMTLFLLPVAFLIFALIAGSNVTFNLNYHRLREYSSFIYFFHGIPIIVFDLFLIQLPVFEDYAHLAKFCFVLIVSLVFARIFHGWDDSIKKHMI